MLRNRSLVIFCFFILSGCATVDNPLVQKIEIPVAVPCKVDAPTAPNTYFENLSQESTIYEKIRALLADRKLYKSYIIELEAALAFCK